MPQASFTSAYRLQLSHNLPFAKIAESLDTLQERGIDALHLSPIFACHSTHGYDVIDPNIPDPHLGTKLDFDSLVEEAKKRGMAVIIDLIPNHMGIWGDNLWWRDVLEKGRRSRYARFFDINWQSDERGLKGKILLPILGESYEEALRKITLCQGKKPYLLYHGYHLPLAQKSSVSRPLKELLRQQHYVLAPWQAAASKINYRRFFNIHELVSLRIEDKKVFSAHHRWVLELAREGKIAGFRIDYPDGLYDPLAYLRHLRKDTALFVVVEKILSPGEKLPCNWPVEGSVGYDFLTLLDALFVDAKQESAFTEVYQKFTQKTLSYSEVVLASKRYFVESEMKSDLHLLGKMLFSLTQNDPLYRHMEEEEISEGVKEFLLALPVYRTYIRPRGLVTKRDRQIIEKALQAAKLQDSMRAFLKKLLLVELAPCYREVVLRLQEVSAPIAAKGIEDTAFYRYTRLLSLCEVGGDPARFGIPLTQFHREQKRRKKEWPYSFLATSTHDCKHSEDLRMRLHVLSEIPKEFEAHLLQWKEATVSLSQPSPATQYFIYQTLLGAWPITQKRFWPLLVKSLREAKEETNWLSPDTNYESQVEEFVKRLFHFPPFLETFLPFQEKIAHLGKCNSLAALILKMGSPGVFDLYQGNERFLYQLVDPDNREEVNFSLSEDEKSLFTKTGLHYRRAHPLLFLEGEYLPLRARGEIVAYARVYEGQHLVVAAGRFFTRYQGGEILLPKGWEGFSWEDLFSGKRYAPREKLHLSKEQVGGFWYAR